MRLTVLLLSMPLAAAMAQAPASGSLSAPGPGTPQQSGSVSMTPVLSDLDRLQSAATETNSVLGRMKIEKWKADGNSKRQAESNADSIQRNLNSALPAMISSVRSAPQDVNAEFRLYRNLNALYDVMSSLTESAGAFGPKGEYESLAPQLETFDSIRRSLGDSIEKLTASTQSELNQLRTQVHTLQQSAANMPPPKKVVVDDNEPVKKTTVTHKKKTAAKKPADSDAASGTAGTSAPAGSTAPQP